MSGICAVWRGSRERPERVLDNTRCRYQARLCRDDGERVAHGARTAETAGVGVSARFRHAADLPDCARSGAPAMPICLTRTNLRI